MRPFREGGGGTIYKNYIDGEWLDGPDVNRDVNPSNTDDVVGEYARDDQAQARAAIAAARAACPAWARGNIQTRAVGSGFSLPHRGRGSG